MLLIAGVGYALVLLSRRITPPRPTPEKLTTYACGEEIRPSLARPDAELFFSPIRRVFGSFYRHVGAKHSGELPTYVWWVLIGALVLVVLISRALGVL
jgi:hypothetical protein